MTPGQRYRAIYEGKPVDHLPRQEFYIWEEALAIWREQGLPEDWNERNLFNYDPPGKVGSGWQMGWCEPPFVPGYEQKIIESQGDYEIIQDVAGRWLKVFTGRRHGFMPDYIRHSVTSMKDWAEDVAPRLDPNNPERWMSLENRCREARDQAEADGLMISHRLIGGYMYLRALMGPEDLLYAFCDQPELIHAMMEGWFNLMDAALARVQGTVEPDEIFMAEDICYNAGTLISPAMFEEFLLPYYQQLTGNARGRQKRRIYLQIDTDGKCMPAIPLYLKVGMDMMSPFEVASGCDVVEIGRQYPDLIMSGGIDKRVLAAGKEAIDAHLRHIMPAMVARGRYIPTCDHGVPSDVSYEDYAYYRARICETDH